MPIGRSGRLQRGAVVGTMTKERKTEIRGVIKCPECGWYIGRKIIRRDGECANCGMEMEDKK